MPRQEEKIRRMREATAKCNPEQYLIRFQVQLSESQLRPSLNARVSKIRLFILEFGFFVLICLFGFVVYQEITRQKTAIDAINISEDLTKRGYTGAVISAKLVDEIYSTGRRIREQSKETTWHEDAKIVNDTIPVAEIPDIVLPNSSWSFHTALRFFLEELDLHFSRIGGEITVNEQTATLTLRKFGGEDYIPPQTVQGNIADMNSLLRQGGNALLLMTNSKAALINAYHFFDIDQKQPSRANAAMESLERIAEYAIQYPPAGDECLAYRLWGLALNDMGHKKEAIEKYQKAVQADPSDPAPYLSWGNTLLMKRPKKAIEKYNKAIEINSKFIYAYYGKGNALLLLQRPEEAIEQFNKAIEIDPKRAYSYYKLGNAFLSSSQPKDAMDHYRKAIELDPKFFLAYNRLGNVFLLLQRPDEAIEQFRKAIEINPEYPNNYQNLGYTLELLNRSEEAKEYINKYNELQSRLQ